MRLLVRVSGVQAKYFFQKGAIVNGKFIFKMCKKGVFR